MGKKREPERKGFYTLSRKLHDWPVGKGFSVRPRDAMADLVAWAAFADGQTLNGARLNRGEVNVSERFCAMAWGWSRNRVRRFIQTLVERGTLAVKNGTSNGTSNGTTYVLVKYDTWQSSGTTHGTTNGTTNGTKEEVRSKKEQLTTVFDERFWPAYPRRSGGEGKDEARKAFVSRVTNDKIPVDLLVSKAGEYQKYCEFKGKINSEWVKLASSWLRRSKGWEEDWFTPRQRATEQLPILSGK